MPRSEDYLDSLLNSISDSYETKESSEHSDSVSRPESQFLSDFEKELAEEFSSGRGEDFIREFERELGLDVSEIGRDADQLDLTSNLVDLDISDNSEVDDSDEIDLSGLGLDLEGLEENDKNEVTIDDSDNDDVEESEEDDILTDIISDIDDVEENDESEGEKEDDDEEVLEEEIPSADASQEEFAQEQDSGENDESEPVSEDEVIDIGNLLDSLDEETSVEMPDDTPKTAIDEDGNPIDEPNVKDDDSASDTQEKKQNIITKILGVITGIFKKKEKEEDAKEDDDDAVALAAAAAGEEIDSGEGTEIDGGIDPDSKEAKKQAKKEEKERKKKEKAEAKKKAAEEKKKKAESKPKKEKKPKKKKAPDNSPRIPIKVLIPFLLLSVSLIVLFNVAKTTLSYEITTNKAQSSFDHEQYLDAYLALSGQELKEDDIVLYNRSKLMATLQLRFDTYEMYAESEPVKALDALVRGCVYYQDHSDEANSLGIPSEFDTLGKQLTQLLSDLYSVSSEDAYDLIEIKNRGDYSKELFGILERKGLWSLED